MSEREVGRIRKKFILISTLSFFTVMLLMGLCIYLFSTLALRNEVRQILEFIVENDGDLIERKGEHDRNPDPQNVSVYTIDENDIEVNIDVDENDIDNGYQIRYILGVGDYLGISREYLYTTRFFAVLFDENDVVEDVKTSHIAYVDDAEALETARKMRSKYRSFGRYQQYYYMVSPRENGGTIVVCLDRLSQIYSINRIMFSAMALLAVGTLLAFLMMRIFSKKIVRSEVENIERQKQFITNAGHELKTPLAIIRANTEMEEVLNGESEWSRSTMRQVDRMNGLIQNLVKVAKAQETDSGAICEMNISPLVLETAESFKPVAIGMDKKLETNVEETVIMKTEEGKLRQLLSIMIDNAVKYCDDRGTITVETQRSGKCALINVKNSYAEGAKVDYSRFFERFYREDSARTISEDKPDNSGNGYGIGLSIASGLVKSMKGRIGVSWKEGVITFSCRLPLKG